jgi:uncharacterized membrane protein
MRQACINCGASLKDNVAICKYCGGIVGIKSNPNKKDQEKLLSKEENKKDITPESMVKNPEFLRKNKILDEQKNKKKIISFKCKCSNCKSIISFDSTDAKSSYSWDGISYWVIACPICKEILDVDENNRIRVKYNKNSSGKSLSETIFFGAKSILDFISGTIIALIWVLIIFAFIGFIISIFMEEDKTKNNTVSNYVTNNNDLRDSNRKISIKFCNETADIIQIALLDWDELNEDWYTSGWTEVNTNACSILRSSRVDKGVYWYAKNKNVTHPLVWEGEFKSCVSEDSFKTKHKNYEPCTGGQKEVGFKYIDLSNTTDIFEQKIVTEKNFIEEDYIETPNLIEIPKKKDTHDYDDRTDITDGYAFGNKIHLNGGSNYGKSYNGFILNKKTEKEDLLVLNGQYDDVLEIYLEQADAGDINAMHNLGLMYIKGLGVNKDLQKGIEYLEKSAENRKWDADSVPLEKARKQLRNSESLQ